MDQQYFCVIQSYPPYNILPRRKELVPTENEEMRPITTKIVKRKAITTSRRDLRAYFVLYITDILIDSNLPLLA